jgi:hypothetical protein
MQTQMTGGKHSGACSLVNDEETLFDDAVIKKLRFDRISKEK